MKKILMILPLLAFLFSCSPADTLSEKILNDEAAVSQHSQYDALPVKLYSAQSGYIVLGSAVVDQWINGTICIANLAYVKEVKVHYSVNQGAWKIQQAQYYKRAPESGKEVWSFGLYFAGQNYQSEWNGLTEEPWDAINAEFAVEYKVNGQTFWDNNNGKNYQISTRGKNALYPTAVLGRSTIAVEGYISPINQMNQYDKVRIAVANIGYEKKVNVIYTLDDWKAVSVLPAVYSGSTTDGSIDYFVADLPDTADSCLHYAASYSVNGTTSWDNNFGSNFTLGYCPLQ
jgi:hypothetical protein